LGVVAFEQTSPATPLRFASLRITLRGGIMAVPPKAKYKEYCQYAAHCLKIVPAITDQEYRAVQREMAAEWLKLANTVLHSSRRQQIQMR
jgi:hypothetical protein